MNEIELMIDLHADGERQGPGNPNMTRRAIELAGLDASKPLRIADLGCGTGAATLILAGALDATVTAVDFSQTFIEKLKASAQQAGLSDSIDAVASTFEELALEEDAFDAIWSEGAIYNIGFERGIREWRRFLKPGGVLAVSEITWLTDRRPAELEAFWQDAYPEIDTASRKFALLERYGYSPVGYFTLPRDCWSTHYYDPLERRYDAFLERHGHSEAAREMVEADRREIDLYRRYAGFYSYGFYIARRCELF
jgi:ubiquinone/menaquinone biosynthesis C-methylase UbiE